MFKNGRINPTVWELIKKSLLNVASNNGAAVKKM